jgi:hypothetical protein
MGCTTSAQRDVTSDVSDLAVANESQQVMLTTKASEATDAIGEKDGSELKAEQLAHEVNAISEEVVSDVPVSMAGLSGGVTQATVLASSSAPAPAVSKTPPLKKGFILKEGHLVKNWKNRFFVLDAGVMTYYESSTDKPPYGVNKKGEIFLRGTTAKVDKNTITVQYDGDVTSREGLAKLVLEIRYPTEREEWFQAIRQHVIYSSSAEPMLQ